MLMKYYSANESNNFLYLQLEPYKEYINDKDIFGRRTKLSLQNICQYIVKISNSNIISKILKINASAIRRILNFIHQDYHADYISQLFTITFNSLIQSYFIQIINKLNMIIPSRIIKKDQNTANDDNDDDDDDLQEERKEEEKTSNKGKKTRRKKTRRKRRRRTKKKKKNKSNQLKQYLQDQLGKKKKKKKISKKKNLKMY